MTVALFLLVLFASVLHALWNFAAKKVAGHLGVLWLGLCLGSLLSWPVATCVYRPENITSKAALYMLATGGLHACYFLLLARAYAGGDLSLVYPVARGTGVAGTAFVAFAWLHEPLSWLGAGGISAVCLGTCILGVGHKAQRETMSAYLYALLVGMTIIGYSVVDKLAVDTVHPILYISGIFTLCATFLAPYMLLWQWAACVSALRLHLPSMVIIGVGSICTYLLILFAFRLGPVSYIVAAREFAVVIGSLLGVVFLHERLTIKKAVGIVAIVCGLIFVKVA
jgi:drug/metabolite transporter (DMT)-like permease